MTSASIIKRNRANARKSTGPLTAQGKATVSANARRHGATSKPDPASVAAWLQIILDKPNLEPTDLLAEDTRLANALALAEAEVRLCIARAALDAFERGEAPAPDFVENMEHCRQLIVEELQFEKLTKRQISLDLSLLGRLHKIIADNSVLGGKRHLLLRRYAREARGHRKRAFQNWLDHGGARQRF